MKSMSIISIYRSLSISVTCELFCEFNGEVVLKVLFDVDVYSVEVVGIGDFETVVWFE